MEDRVDSSLAHTHLIKQTNTTDDDRHCVRDDASTPQSPTTINTNSTFRRHGAGSENTSSNCTTAGGARSSAAKPRSPLKRPPLGNSGNLGNACLSGRAVKHAIYSRSVPLVFSADGGEGVGMCVYYSRTATTRSQSLLFLVCLPLSAS